MPIETIKIVCAENKRAGYAIINKSDFDPKNHKEFKEPTKPAAEEKANAKKNDETK